ncbi:MAG: HD domain-containing phosphohydrolase [Pseudomonadota bacterium]
MIMENNEKSPGISDISDISDIQNTPVKPRILCVDDEPNILSSLRRLFRGKGYEVLVANSGQEGLAMLETEHIDLIISDMRMPIMDGAAFLEKVRARWPDTLRLLLTGFADIQSIINAINRGEIYRYITKPWDDNDIILVVKQALERKELEKEKKRLEELTLRQNDELKELNNSLEQKVLQRTNELKSAHDSLIGANEKLRNSFLTSIKVFSNVIEMRSGKLVGHSRQVADLARKIARKMKLNPSEIQDVFVAGLLSDIGKIGFTDELINTPMSQLSSDQLGAFHKHTIRAEQLLMPLDDLLVAAKIIRSQHERYDGLGLPEGLHGDLIPLGARILSVASDFHQLQIGMLTSKRLFADEAKAFIIKGAGNRYDPMVIEAFKRVFDVNDVEHPLQTINVKNMLPGMVLASDLISKEGLLLLPAEYVLEQNVIEKLRLFTAGREENMQVSVYPKRKT